MYNPFELSVKKLKSIDVTVYPNPTVDFIALPIHDPVHYFEVIDVSGRMAPAKMFDNQRLDVSQLPSGVYQLRYIVANKSYLSKFVKL